MTGGPVPVLRAAARSTSWTANWDETAVACYAQQSDGPCIVDGDRQCAVVAQGKFSAPFTIEGTLPDAATIRGLSDYVEGNLAVPWSWSFPSVGTVPVGISGSPRGTGAIPVSSFGQF